MEEEIKNAKIKSYQFDTERGLTMWIDLDYGGSGQGFGGHLLYPTYDVGNKVRKGHGFCGHFVVKVLEVTECSDLKDIVGKCVRVKRTGSKVKSIGHIIEDKWFTPSEEFDVENDE